MYAEPILNMEKIETIPDETDPQFIGANQFLLQASCWTSRHFKTDTCIVLRNGFAKDHLPAAAAQHEKQVGKSKKILAQKNRNIYTEKQRVFLFDKWMQYASI